MELYGEVKYIHLSPPHRASTRARTPGVAAGRQRRLEEVAACGQHLGRAPPARSGLGHPTEFVHPVRPRSARGGGMGGAALAQPICTAREPHSTRAGSGGAEDTIRILLWLLLEFDQCAEHAAFGVGVRLAYRRTLRLDFSINT